MGRKKVKVPVYTVIAVATEDEVAEMKFLERHRDILITSLGYCEGRIKALWRTLEDKYHFGQGKNQFFSLDFTTREIRVRKKERA